MVQILKKYGNIKIKLLFFCVCHIFILVIGLNGQVADSAGTGFFITNDGVIVTCAHVIRDAINVTVRIDNHEHPADILIINNVTDIAILKINYQNNFHFKLGHFDTVVIGDLLSVWGYPLPSILGSEISVVNGNISALSSGSASFRHTAITNSGNSGGPILNNNFEVIGIHTSRLSDTIEISTIRFGTKVDYIKNELINININHGTGNIRNPNDAGNATVQIFAYLTEELFSNENEQNIANFGLEIADITWDISDYDQFIMSNSKDSEAYFIRGILYGTRFILYFNRGIIYFTLGIENFDLGILNQSIYYFEAALVDFIAMNTDYEAVLADFKTANSIEMNLENLQYQVEFLNYAADFYEYRAKFINTIIILMNEMGIDVDY